MIKKNNSRLIKGLCLIGFSILGTVVKEQLRYHYRRGKKPRPDIEDELDELSDMLDDLKKELSESESQEKQKQEHQDSIPKPQSLKDILSKPKTEYSFLFGPWIWEGGITVLFSPTKLGKTTCAVQIANDIACGSPSKMLPEELNKPHSPQAVLYYDLESDETDFQDRYGMVPDEFPDNLVFIFDVVFDTSEALMDSIENNVFLYNGNVTVVVDNTSMVGDSKYQAKTEQLVKRIKNLQTRFKENGHLLTFILVAHTHKTADDKIELEDISGSSNFANLSRCILTIEKSGFGNDHRILKLLSTRKKEGIGDGQVIVAKRCSDPFLHFEYVATMNEDDALAGKDPSQTGPKPKQKPGPKEPKYPTLNTKQIEQLKMMVDGIKAGESMEIDGEIFDTQHKIAQYYKIPDTYVKKYYDGEKTC